jgi:tripartite-type tricarboxylate transporter receptor subunit TctC
MKSWLVALALTGLVVWNSPAAGQAYPAKPIRMVVPAAAGGVSDILARVTADHLSRALGQPVIVDNRGGAGGNLGADIVAKAQPDGYSLCLISLGNVAINPFLMKDMPFDALTDLVPVAPVAVLPQVVVATSSLPANNLKELIGLAKREPGKLNYGSAGHGTTTQLAAELLAQMGGIQLVHVPYRGAAPAVVDVAAGQVQLAFVGLASAQPLLATGKIKILAVAADKRLSAAPDIPTSAEAGLPGYEFSTWFGLVTSRGTPTEIVAQLNHHVQAMFDEPAVQKRLLEGGLEPLRDSPEEFGARIKRDNAKFAAIIKTAGLKPE